MFRLVSISLGVALAAQSMPGAAQPAPTSVTAVQGDRLILPAGTRIVVALNSEVNSTEHQAGFVFRLMVAQDVRIGDVVVIPRGTRAMGEITWRSGRGGFGRSGKMNYSIRYLELNDRRIPVVGNFRQEGEGATLLTSAAIGIAGVLGGAVVTGERARISAGRELTVSLADATPFVLVANGAQLDPSFRPRTVEAVMASEAELTRAAAEANCRTYAPATAQRNARSLEQHVQRCVTRATQERH